MRDTAKNTADTDAAARIREAAAALARHRASPCLLFVSGSLVHRDVLTVRTALGSARGDHLDVIVAGPGGRSEAAYLLARELRRRFAQLTAYVPFEAKSAATLLCLAADELVLALPDASPVRVRWWGGSWKLCETQADLCKGMLIMLYTNDRFV